MNEDKRAKTHGIPAGKTGDIEHMNTISFLSCIAIPPQVFFRLRRDFHIPNNARST